MTPRDHTADKGWNILENQQEVIERNEDKVHLWVQSVKCWLGEGRSRMGGIAPELPDMLSLQQTYRDKARRPDTSDPKVSCGTGRPIGISNENQNR